MIPQSFAEAGTLRDKIFFALSVMQKGSAEEIATEIVELQGIASEEGVADITLDVETEMEKLLEEGAVETVKEHRQKKRYALTGKNV